ncbi:MAG: NADH-quinone oxidoreductase subunit C, partial [Dermacoccus nishinomiyaensis]
MSREPRRVDVALDEWIATHEAHRADGYTFFDFVTAVDETDRDLPDKPAGFDLVSHLY